ncbi:MAG: glycoside hydrolase family 25 protein [Eubacteriales bacterium]|nr:glycoside hydrolase family 25 protein [Eubacteriales bacterium]
MDTLEEKQEQLDTVFPEEPEQPARPRGLRPEWVMGILALLSALALGAALVFSLPRMFPDEDPQAVLDRSHPLEVTTEPTILEPTISETEPENPTIPPDRNPYDRFDFQYTRHNYLLLQDLPSTPGVDVSSYQGDIDWIRVKNSGIQFAIIRLGYRGYGTGKLVEDDKARQNLEGARAAGLDVGAYFFSQALSIHEVDQEIEYMLEILGDHRLDMPIILDWEIPADNARTVGMDPRTLTDLQLHFCQVMTEKGYQPMVYFNWHQSENLYFLSEMEDYPFWLALYQDRMTYPWKVEMWQYTDNGRVPGIEGPVDVNVYMPD